MLKELDYQLVKDFPGLYRERFLDMSKTCMCWGFQCNDGWEPLIRNLSEQLQCLMDTFHVEIMATCVKEKFGELRFHFMQRHESEPNTENPLIYEMIAACVQRAEHLSANRCEKCGEYGFLCKKGWWYKTLCKTHARELEYARANDFRVTVSIPEGDYCYERKVSDKNNCPFIHFCDEHPGSWCSLLKELPTEGWELDENNNIPKLEKCKRRFSHYVGDET